MKRKCKKCGNKVKKVSTFTDIIWGKFITWYCKNCDRMCSNGEVEPR